MNIVTMAKAPTSREKLLHALYEAAELEQNLMCTYLYAAFSLKQGTEEGLSAQEADAVSRWRRTIMSVAIDEMGHLAAVWNITAAVGGAPRFGRTNFPLGAGYLPAGVVVKLAPFNEAVIQHFIHLERPHGSAEPDGEGFIPVVAATRTPPRPLLTPTGCDYDTVGTFYATIRENLGQLVAQLGERTVFCGDPALHLSPDEVSLPGIIQVTDLASAMEAIDVIVTQGEGATEHHENSHFSRFIEIREEMRALKAANPAFQPAFPAAHNPVLRKPPHPEGMVWLEDPEAVATVDLANAVYALALRLLAGSYAVAGPSADKSLYVDVSISLMHVLGRLAERAVRLPAGPSNPDCNAGVSFTALRDAASLPPGPGARLVYAERVGELAAVANAMDQDDARIAKASRLLSSLAAKLSGHGGEDADIAGGEQAAPTSDAPAIVADPAPDDPANGKDIAISFDGRRCIHGRQCVTQGAGAFLEHVKGPWIIADAMPAEEIAAVIRQCPSGALTYRRRDGQDEAAPPANVITLRENGPYAVRAAFRIDGSAAGFRATLCRCGGSRNKPFCDKSHNYNGFTATGDPAARNTDALETRDGPLSITPLVNGPLMIEGNLEIDGGTGAVINRGRKVKLCRCGASASKPFCDNSHVRIGFQSN